MPKYENRDFFCSQKAECLEKDAEKVSEKLYEFCKEEVIKSVNKYLKELKMAEKKEPIRFNNGKNFKDTDKGVSSLTESYVQEKALENQPF